MKKMTLFLSENVTLCKIIVIIYFFELLASNAQVCVGIDDHE